MGENEDKSKTIQSDDIAGAVGGFYFNSLDRQNQQIIALLQQLIIGRGDNS